MDFQNSQLHSLPAGNLFVLDQGSFGPKGRSWLKPKKKATIRWHLKLRVRRRLVEREPSWHRQAPPDCARREGRVLNSYAELAKGRSLHEQSRARASERRIPFLGQCLDFGHALSRVPVKIADVRRFLSSLWCHLGRVGLTRNAAGSKLLSCQVVLGRPLVFADFGGHDLPSFLEQRP
jgi:hypothetical protein